MCADQFLVATSPRLSIGAAFHSCIRGWQRAIHQQLLDSSILRLITTVAPSSAVNHLSLPPASPTDEKARECESQIPPDSFAGTPSSRRACWCSSSPRAVLQLAVIGPSSLHCSRHSKRSRRVCLCAFGILGESWNRRTLVESSILHLDPAIATPRAIVAAHHASYLHSAVCRRTCNCCMTIAVCSIAGSQDQQHHPARRYSASPDKVQHVSRLSRTGPTTTLTTPRLGTSHESTIV